MARVFLSYDREDAAKARRIAQALERAGHSVWWDFHIKGGAEYGTEIEQALADADAIVVLWSHQSVHSAWVRDEAAAGRDRACLVPVRLDDAPPPLGFRQYQSIDFAGWKGLGKPPHLREVIVSIEGLAGKQPQPSALEAGVTVTPKLRPSGRLALIMAVVIAAIAAIAATYFLISREGASNVHTVAVTAADPSARPVARDLIANLGSLNVEQSGSLRLTSQDDESADNPDLVLETASSAAPGQMGAGLVLKSGKGSGVLWSKDFTAASGNPANLKQQMAVSAGRVLGCAIEGLDAEERPLNEASMKLYLSACYQSAEVSGSDDQSVIAVLSQVLGKAPRFKAAWRRLLLAESNATIADRDTPLPFRKAAQAAGKPKARDRLRFDLARARQVEPDMPEAVVAEVALLPANAFGEALRSLDRAKKNHPDNVSVLGFRAAELMRVGRLAHAIADAQRAAELAPFSPSAVSSYVMTLAYAGRIDAALAELERAERLWPDTDVLRKLQYEFNWHFGDPVLALNLTPPGLPKGREMFLRARAQPTQANINQFLSFIRAMYERQGRTDLGSAILQEFAAFHQEDELYRRLLDPRNKDISSLSDEFFQPPLKTFRQDRRFMQVARKAGLLNYWRTSGIWPDFCFEEELPYDCKEEAAKLAA